MPAYFRCRSNRDEGVRVQWLLRFATPAPDETIDPNLVTPGVIGFIATFGIAIAVVLLVVDMTRRVRRINYRAQANERLDAEDAAATAQERTPDAE
jgi:hypothetical protein